MHHTIEILINSFAKLPGIGPRSARRLALHLIKNRNTLMTSFIGSMNDVCSDVCDCEICGNLDACSPCSICSSESRDTSIICIVEDVMDLWALERSCCDFNGLYHALGGKLSAIDGIGIEDLRLKELEDRIKNDEVKEIILAISATTEGQITHHYIHERISNINASIEISCIAHGIPIGGELDYLDDGTISAAINKRIVTKIPA